MHTRSLLLLSAALFLCHTGTAQVDGFNKGKGNMDLVFSLGYEQGLDYYLAEGTAGLSRYRASASFFAARGLTKNLDVQFSAPFIASNGSAGLQDAQLFLKWLPVQARLGKGTLTFGAALGGSAPMTNYQTEGLGAIGQQARSIIPMGIVQYRTDGGTFVSVVGGQMVVNAPTPDAYIGTFRLGRATNTYYGEFYVQMQQAMGGKDYLGVGELAPSTFKELGVDLVRAGVKYYKPFAQRYGWVVETSYVLDGRNVDQSVLVAGSLIRHFRK